MDACLSLCSDVKCLLTLHLDLQGVFHKAKKSFVSAENLGKVRKWVSLKSYE